MKWGRTRVVAIEKTISSKGGGETRRGRARCYVIWVLSFSLYLCLGRFSNNITIEYGFESGHYIIEVINIVIIMLVYPVTNAV